ncbi:General amino-acid permease GAP1 [Cercospora beticola]|uniref:General amino-acid permease GAP1 n=1 Tax=Cercospora beticola TaxID=122368 RepID=A0A2G5HDU1_CERBT|nr:General amino-acid permease GAP1 [Cercospora beticola]PIA90443.1 General amino-acid permease GAP1 [Cercospora beticola]WPB08066.1 hypothetical protein RHO25_012730 [Cercospora beticola]CAK1368072.1 unnamed protein product [Cercospora beticola]
MDRHEEKQMKMEYSPSEDSPGLPEYGEHMKHRPKWTERFVESFKRDPNAHATPRGTIGADGRVFDVEGAAAGTATSPLQRSLKGRHLQMIAIGGSIGTGLFVGSGSSLATGGPASLLVSFSLVGIMMYCTVHALGEMAVLFPVSGSFSAYSTRFIDPAWGFAMGWNYAMQWLVVLPLEIVAATITIEYWSDGSISNNAWVSIFLVMIVVINLFGVKGYGEAEFVFAIIKVIAIVGYILLGIILNCGGGPGGPEAEALLQYSDAYAFVNEGGYIGGTFWHHPGPFKNGFKGLCSVFVTAAFAFAGTELVGLAAAETENPRKSLPTAVKQVFWRIALFYLVSLTIVGLLVPYDDRRLVNGSSSYDAKASPFVISIVNAGISGLPSVFNVVIMIAVLSVGNSSIYGSSRTLAALADQNQAPKILGYIDRKGRPIVAIGLASVLGLLAFFAGSDKQTEAFNWMLALSGLSSIFTWGSICFAHIRFRAGWKRQGHSLSELAFTSQPGVVGSWIGFLFNVLVLATQFWTAAWPVKFGGQTTSQRVQGFFLSYLAAPVVIITYLVYKIWMRTPIIRSHNMDLHTGIRDLNIAELIDEERAERATWPTWKRVYKIFC